MQTEKQRERLVELLDNLPNGELLTKDVADYLMSNNVVVLQFEKGDIVYHLAHGYVEEEIVAELISEYGEDIIKETNAIYNGIKMK